MVISQDVVVSVIVVEARSSPKIEVIVVIGVPLFPNTCFMHVVVGAMSALGHTALIVSWRTQVVMCFRMNVPSPVIIQFLSSSGDVAVVLWGVGMFGRSGGLLGIALGVLVGGLADLSVVRMEAFSRSPTSVVQVAICFTTAGSLW